MFYAIISNCQIFKKGSCSSTPSTPASSSIFKFTVSGESYEWDGYSKDSNGLVSGSVISKVSGQPWELCAKDNKTKNQICLSIAPNTSKLTTGTYNQTLSISSQGTVTANDLDGEYFGVGTWIINITSITGNLASGTFSGGWIVISGSVPNSIQIKDGTFTNVLIQQ